MSQLLEGKSLAKHIMLFFFIYMSYKSARLTGPLFCIQSGCCWSVFFYFQLLFMESDITKYFSVCAWIVCSVLGESAEESLPVIQCQKVGGPSEQGKQIPKTVGQKSAIFLIFFLFMIQLFFLPLFLSLFSVSMNHACIPSFLTCSRNIRQCANLISEKISLHIKLDSVKLLFM